MVCFLFLLFKILLQNFLFNNYFLGFRLTNQRSLELIEMWKKVQHSNIISLRDVFSTKEFNGEHGNAISILN